MKHLKMTSVAFLAAGIMALITACNMDVPHEHTFATEWTTDATHHWHAATCEHKDEVSGKAEHSFGEWIVKTAATEEAKGSKEKNCSVCGYKVTEEIAKLEHTHKFAEAWTTDATHHWHAATCEHKDEVSGKAEHSFGEWSITKQPTEDAEGARERTCSVCGYKATDTIAKLDHVHAKGTHHDAVAGTCVTKGKVEYYDCVKATCEVKLDADGKPLTTIEGVLNPSNHTGTATTWTKTATTHKETYNCCGAVKTPEAAHTFGEWKSNNNATTQADGTKTRICSDCKYEETVTDVGTRIVETPVFSVALGDVNSGTSVTLTCATEGAKIYYTTDGSEPTASSTEFTTAINVTVAVTLKAIAVKDRMHNSAVASASYTMPPEGFAKVLGGIVTGAAYTDNYKGVFPAGRNVTLSPFYMGKYEVTQAQYKSVMAGQKVTVDGTEYTLADSPSLCVQGSTKYKVDNDKDHANYPVENVTWFDAVYYCNALSAKEGLQPCYAITVTTVSSGHITAATVEYEKSKNGYRLPTEAEWEYAARGGDPTKPDWNYTFSGANKAEGTSYSNSKNAGLDSVGWYCYNNITGTTGDSNVTNSADGKGTHEVGKKTANALGIYDMSGNVWEWCYDRYGSTSSETVTDPAGASSGDNRVCRGGSWYYNAYCASVSYRRSGNPDYKESNLGFRVCRNAN